MNKNFKTAFTVIGCLLLAVAVSGAIVGCAAQNNITEPTTEENDDTFIIDIPTEEIPTEETPVEEDPIEDAPVEEVPAEEDAPIEESPIEEDPVEETPVEETPVDTVDETEESPVEEAPVEEVEEVEYLEVESLPKTIVVGETYEWIGALHRVGTSYDYFGFGSGSKFVVPEEIEAEYGLELYNVKYYVVFTVKASTATKGKYTAVYHTIAEVSSDENGYFIGE